MKELFDRLRAEAERRELPQPAELRAYGDRRAARRAAAGIFSLALVVAGGLVAARPLLHERAPVTADGIVVSSPQTTTPQPREVPNVVGMTRGDAMSVLMLQGFKVQVMTASPARSGDPDKVRLQDPVSALRIPSQTTVTIWVDQPAESVPACADRYPKQLPATLFVQAETEICFAPGEPPAPPESLPELLPEPCTPKVLASESLVEDRRGFYATLTEQPASGSAPTIARQVITRYNGAGAKDYLSELSKDVGRCQPVTRGGLRLTYTMAQGQLETIGEQSLLISVEYRYLEKPASGPTASSYLVCVVRVGVHVVVVYDKGWEGMPSRRATILDLAREISRRIT